MSDVPYNDAVADRSGGLFASLQRLFATLLATVQTRVEIVATELEEERERIKQFIVLGVVALVFVSLGTVVLTIFATLWLWETLGIQALGVIGAVLLLAGAVVGGVVFARERSRPRLFSTTLAELAKDGRALRGEHE